MNQTEFRNSPWNVGNHFVQPPLECIMDFKLHSHRFGTAIAAEEDYRSEWEEIIHVLKSIADKEIIAKHREKSPNSKSVSKAINLLIHESLKCKGWAPESSIFNDPEYSQTRWRLDFAKEKISIEVAFNHGEAIAWNLLKPVLASELNHVEKDAQTSLGVVIMATEALKAAGGFDSAVGTYEKAIRYLKPLQNQLTCPMVLIGLEAPKSFIVQHEGKPKRARFVKLTTLDRDLD